MRDRNLLALLLVSLMAAPVLVIQARLRSESHPERQPLSLLPMQIGKWIGDDVGFDGAALEGLIQEEHLFRAYQSATDAQTPISLFIEYLSKDSEAMIHKEEDMCRPGRRWVVTDRRRTTRTGPNGSEFSSNQFVASNADDKVLVEYWYKIHDRTFASQYGATYYLRYDRLRRKRSDGALLMVTTLLARGESVEAAQARLQSFEFELNPLLDRYIPR